MVKAIRVFTVICLFSVALFAHEHRQVCSGPSADGEARCHAHVRTDGTGKPMAATAPTGYSPTQIRTAYNLPSTTNGAGQTVAIVDAYDDPKIEADLGVYSTYYGLPACTTANGCFKKVSQTGSTTKLPKSNAGWSLEIALDVETVHAICPLCKILLVEANSASYADLLAAEDYAVAHATVVSNSWGGSESSGETSYDTHFNHPGIPITVSSGDSGYGVEYPASSQFVTAVGGTTLTLNTNGTIKTETAWSGAGSGCSAYEPKPSWQTDTGCVRRTVADVSAVADPNTGVSVYDSVTYSGQSGWFTVGGTSLASPLIASVYALAGNGAATIDAAYPYAHKTGLRDITSGSNGSCSGSYLCTSVTGYDGPTGLGAPTGATAF